MTQPPASVTLTRPAISEKVIDAASATLRSGWLGYGPRCLELERMFVERRGGWALATQSCTAALWAVAMVARSGSEPEIIVPANAYIACASAFRVAGWKVRLCDVDPTSGLLDLDDVSRHVNPNTRALLVVDTYGQRFPEDEARRVCDAHGLWLVRDAAHRLDLDAPATPLADFVCYSFGPTKEVASPDGGLIWAGTSVLEGQARAFTYWGIAQDTWQRASTKVHVPITLSTELGMKLRMTDVNASMILAQLADWPGQRDRRRMLLKAYRDALEGTVARLLSRKDDDSCLMAPLLVDPVERASIRSSLAALGIATSDHYPTLASLLDGPHPACPNADEFCASVVAVPMHTHLTHGDIARIASAFHDLFADDLP